MSSKYKDAVKYLEKHPDEIYDNWNFPYTAKAGILFQKCQPKDSHKCCGCLTQVRCGSPAVTNELTRAIQNDERIPKFGDDIKPEHLPVFAEWQKLMSEYFRNFKSAIEEVRRRAGLLP